MLGIAAAPAAGARALRPVACRAVSASCIAPYTASQPPRGFGCLVFGGKTGRYTRARARVNLVYTDWTAAECHEVAARHARRALPDAPTDFSIYSLMTAESVTLADQLVHEECGEPNPLAWVWLADSALYAERGYR